MVELVVQDATKELSPSRRATSWELMWLCGLILSFSYEMPIFELTVFDRLNPRFFDIIILVGLFTILPTFDRFTGISPLLRAWAAVVLVFCSCALLWSIFFFPWEYGKFSLFFAGKYVEGLTAIYIASKIPLDEHQKKIIHHIVVIGGIFVALYAIPEYFTERVGVTERTISGGKIVLTWGRVIFGPLSHSYFHIGMFSTLAFAMALSIVPTVGGTLKSLCYLCVALFVAWPAVVCGSRAALGATVIVLLATSYFQPILRKKVALIVGAFLLGYLLFNIDLTLERLQEISLGVARFVAFRGDDPDSILNRLSFSLPFQSYIWGGVAVPIIGAGFYVAPIGSDVLTAFYRIGYGIHNTYLFPLEQGGVMAFLFFMLFLVRAFRGLYRMQRSVSAFEGGFASGALTFLIAILGIAGTGQVFWQGFNTGNLNTYIVLIFVLGTQRQSIQRVKACVR